MRVTDLVEGQRYVLTGDVVGQYQGRHDGILELADGSRYLGENGYLKFTVLHQGSGSAEGGSVQTVLVRNGTEVIEPEETRRERLRQEEQRKAAVEAATAGAVEFLRRIGFASVGEIGPHRRQGRVNVDNLGLYGAVTETDQVKISGLTIGDLRQLLKSTS